MEFKDKIVGNLLVSAILDARIAEAAAPDLKATLVAHFARRSQIVVLDLSAVTFIDSSGLGALISVLNKLGDGGDLVLCGITGAVASMFKLTRMDKVFRIFPTADDAIRALSEPIQGTTAK